MDSFSPSSIFLLGDAFEQQIYFGLIDRVKAQQIVVKSNSRIEQPQRPR
jgi:hypothetical protein